MHNTHAPQPQHETAWPQHLRVERTSTSLGRGTRLGLGVTAAVLASLLGVAWTGAVPAPTEPTPTAPVATTR